MTQARIQRKFYPLQHEEWLRICKELTPSQINVLYFIRTLDPNGESLLPRVTEIAKVLKLDKATVNCALKTLGQQGYIDWQPTNKDNIEQQVRDRLQSQLGGLIEAVTICFELDITVTFQEVEL
jgi:DNA-binding MarR family transcriptional regulator